MTTITELFDAAQLQLEMTGVDALEEHLPLQLLPFAFVVVDTKISRMPKRSAGLLMYRHSKKTLEVFLVHPGGPLWAKKDKGAWTIPKGEYEPDESPLAAARREFEEETGFQALGEFFDLGTVKQKSGKLVMAWTFEGDCDPATLTSNTCEIEWPPHSGLRLEIPEVDRGRWFPISEANEYIREEQRELLRRLQDCLAIDRGEN